MLVNVAISIVIEKMMDKEDEEERPERVYPILRIPKNDQLVIMLKNREEKERIISEQNFTVNEDDDWKEQEVWIFPDIKDGKPNINDFPPIAIREVEAISEKMEDPVVKKKLKEMFPENTEAELDEKVSCTVMITLWKSLMGTHIK